MTPTDHPENAAANTLKWFALLLMLACHVFLAFPAPLAQGGMALGAPCLTLFASLATYRMAGDPDRLPILYLRRLLPWALLAQGPFAALRLSFAPWWSLNILFSLALGALLCLAWRRAYWWGALLVPALIAVSGYLDGGAGIPLAMAAAFALARYTGPRLAPILVQVLLAQLLSDIIFLGYYAHVSWHLCGLALVPGLWWLAGKIATPRPPSLLFYGLYPGHLLLIWIFAGAYRSELW